MTQVRKPERPPQEIIVPFGRRSWNLPIYPPVVWSVNSTAERVIPNSLPEGGHCEIRRGIFNLGDRPYPFNPDATIHICPHHFAVIYWTPRGVP